MKIKLIILTLLLMSTAGMAQVGFNCQYVPGIQLGRVKVKSDHYGVYKYSAGLPTMMIDRLKGKWYSHMDLTSLYYMLTQINKAKYLKIAKNEGGVASFRFGYAFGKGESFRAGPLLSAGFSQSNLDSIRNVYDANGYYNFGGGVMVYNKINGKISVMGKLGYEKMKGSKQKDLEGSNKYLELTVAYKIYQKFGVSVMPSWNSRNYSFTNREGVLDNGKLKMTSLRIGLTKFY